MNHQLLSQRIETLLAKRNFLVIVAGVLLLALVLQSLVLFKVAGNQRILLIPMPLRQPGWVDKASVSESYLAEMSRYYSSLFLNRTPEDDFHQIAEILHFAASEDYGQLKSDLVAQNDMLQKNHLSTWFSPAEVSVNLPALSADIKGELHLVVGKEEIAVDKKTYRLRFAYKNGALLIKSFAEVDSHEMH